MTEIMPSLQNLIKLSYDSPGFRAFFQELCAAIDMDGEQGISQEDCAAFAEALSASAVTSMN